MKRSTGSRRLRIPVGTPSSPCLRHHRTSGMKMASSTMAAAHIMITQTLMPGWNPSTLLMGWLMEASMSSDPRGPRSQW
jgi:hypothetical protein